MLDVLWNMSSHPLQSAFVPDYNRVYKTEKEAVAEFDEATLKELENTKTEEDLENLKLKKEWLDEYRNSRSEEGSDELSEPDREEVGQQIEQMESGVKSDKPHRARRAVSSSIKRALKVERGFQGIPSVPFHKMPVVTKRQMSYERSTPYDRFQQREVNFNVFVDDYLN
jgi:hypothetical protein